MFSTESNLKIYIMYIMSRVADPGSDWRDLDPTLEQDTNLDLNQTKKNEFDPIIAEFDP